MHIPKSILPVLFLLLLVVGCRTELIRVRVVEDPVPDRAIVVTVTAQAAENALLATQVAVLAAESGHLATQVATLVIPTPTNIPTVTHTPPPAATPTPFACPAIEPYNNVQCPPIGDCVFEVAGCFPDVDVKKQTVVVLLDPGGGNWWPQNLDFPVEFVSVWRWEGKAKIGAEGPQPSGTEFRIMALLVKRTEVPTVMQPYKELPPSDDAFGPFPLTVE